MAFTLTGCGKAPEPASSPASSQQNDVSSAVDTVDKLDYSDDALWVEVPAETDKPADTFFILPTVNLKNLTPGNEDIFDERGAQRFVKTLNMEKGVVAEATNVFAPFYRQKTMGCFLNEAGAVDDSQVRADDNSPYAELAFQDIRDAFLQYLENRNSGRPFVIFGYSQGADLAVRLIDELGENPLFKERFVAAYAIGTVVDETYLAAHPNVRMAQNASDTGVVVAYNAVSEEAELPATKQMAINPLNWRTDATPASNSENLGFVLCDTDGSITKEQASYCGAYLDEKSGVLVVTDLQSPEEVTQGTSELFTPGDLHLFDIQLFYRNLQQNVQTRVEAFGQAGSV